MAAKDEAITYIALDCEGGGQNPLIHPTLSIGACVVTPKLLSFEARRRRGLYFYAELRPNSLEFETEAMQVGCLELECLKPTLGLQPAYNPKHSHFSPRSVLEYMRKHCELGALDRFRSWVEQVSDGTTVVAVTDTVFYDSVRFAIELAKKGGKSPFGHKGLDLASLYCGMEGLGARLSDLERGPERFLKLEGRQVHHHHAGHDACYTADIASLLFGVLKMGW